MLRTACLSSFCVLLLSSQLGAQEVVIAREETPKYPKAQSVGGAQVTINQPVVQPAMPASVPAVAQPTFALSKPEPSRLTFAPVAKANPQTSVTTQHRPLSATIPIQTTAVPPRLTAHAAAVVPAKPQEPKKAVAVAPAAPKPVTNTAVATAVTTSAARPAAESPTKVAANDTASKVDPAPKASTPPSPKPNATVAPPVSTQLSPLIKPTRPLIASRPEQATSAEPTLLHGNERRISMAAAPQPVSFSGDSAFVKLADGFDFPVGKPEAQGYYKARGFRSHGHLGEDWDGVGGGDTDLGDPIYAIGDGVVVFARDCHMGWGNVLIIRHSYREAGSVRTIDSLYGHLNSILVKRGQSVARGQKIATLGNAHGLYDAHLHLEIRKNLEIGMSRAAFARDFSNYYDPSQFIVAHRHLGTSGGTYRVAMNTFTHDARINWDKARNFSHAHTGGGSSESAAALRKALAEKR